MGSFPFDSHVGLSSHYGKEITQSDPQSQLQTAQGPSTEFYFSSRKFNSLVICQLTSISSNEVCSPSRLRPTTVHFLLSTQLSPYSPTHSSTKRYLFEIRILVSLMTLKIKCQSLRKLCSILLYNTQQGWRQWIFAAREPHRKPLHQSINYHKSVYPGAVGMTMQEVSETDVLFPISHPTLHSEDQEQHTR